MSDTEQYLTELAEIIVNGGSQAANAAVEECHRVIDNDTHAPNSCESESNGDDSKKGD